MIEILNEMAITRNDAMNRCLELSDEFIKHFLTIYNNENDRDFNHHTNEMTNFWRQVRKLRLKPKNKPILDGDLRDWFFTGGGDLREMIDDEDALEFYDKMCTKLLNDNSLTIKEVYYLVKNNNY